MSNIDPEKIWSITCLTIISILSTLSLLSLFEFEEDKPSKKKKKKGPIQPEKKFSRTLLITPDSNKGKIATNQGPNINKTPTHKTKVFGPKTPIKEVSVSRLRSY
jgi:hypothetical protein